jgi:hypothetical protein
MLKGKVDDVRRGFVPQVEKRLVMKSFQPSLSLISHSSACRASFIPRAKLNRTLITQKNKHTPPLSLSLEGLVRVSSQIVENMEDNCFVTTDCVIVKIGRFKMC